jgi:hypothetical protein
MCVSLEEGGLKGRKMERGKKSWEKRKVIQGRFDRVKLMFAQSDQKQNSSINTLLDVRSIEPETEWFDRSPIDVHSIEPEIEWFV